MVLPLEEMGALSEGLRTRYEYRFSFGSTKLLVYQYIIIEAFIYFYLCCILLFVLHVGLVEYNTILYYALCSVFE